MKAVEPAIESRISDGKPIREFFWLVALSLFAALGCADTTCRGVAIDGECQTRCLDSECDEGSLCVDNRCAPSCTEDSDCESQSCRRRQADNGNQRRVCDPAAESMADGGFTPQCQLNSHCEAEGQRCVDGACRVVCQLHDHCGGAGSCSQQAQDEEGNAVLLCVPDEFPREQGEYGALCPDGGNDCASDFRCVSAGEGDADAYCTATGCDANDDCPTGFFCSHNRTLRPPCSAACGNAGNPSDPNCIPLDDIGEGETFRCSNDGELELRICLHREYCSECDSDADCRAVPNQVCAEGGDSVRICTVLCDPSTNSCPWGSASECDIWDERLGLPTCGHRSGSCRGDGDSCDPCLDDRDCPRGFCSLNSFTSEQFCVDETATCSCATNQQQCLGGGCPETPGGLTMNCVPRAEGRAPDACFGAPTVAQDPTSSLGCWPRQ